MWIHPVDTLDLVVKGVIIGVAASAPMGPVGVLTVQRTLNKGRWLGFATGMGAALSDLLYALLTGLGMSFVMDFVQNPRNMTVLQLVGTVLLFLFGLYTYRSNPLHGVHASSGNRGTLASNFFTGFMITISNPLIVFLFVALYARFAFIVPEHRIEQTFGYLGLAWGALLWWYGLTYFIHKVREQFHVKHLVWINRTIGIVVMVVSLLGFYFTIRGRSLY